MSGDEVVALIISLVIAIWGWKQWVGGLVMLNSLSRRTATQLIGWLLPLVAGAAMLFVLLFWASEDVRDSQTYIFFYLAMWLGWTGLWNRMLPYVGLSCRDDALERHNTAAGLAIGGGLIGVTLIFAGGNIGNGPGWWVVVFCAALGTAVVLVLWIISNHISRIDEAITVDRDVATGLRTAGFFVGSGLILGRALAGDWQSASQTVSDFIAKGWPVLTLWVVMVLVQVLSRPTPDRPVPDRILFGFVPSLIFVSAGVGVVLMQGHW